MGDIVKKLQESRKKSELFRIKNELEKEHLRLSNLEKELTDRENLLNEQEKFEARDVEYHSQSYAAFFNTRMEKDKSILTLSVVGVGYLASFAKLGDSKLLGFELYFFIIASCSFLISIAAVIQIFKLNADYIMLILNSPSAAMALDKKLKIIDKLVLWAFSIGLCSTIFLGYIASNN